MDAVVIGAARHGARFDLRHYHEAALGGGTVPFDVLDARVQQRYAGSDRDRQAAPASARLPGSTMR